TARGQDAYALHHVLARRVGHRSQGLGDADRHCCDVEHRRTAREPGDAVLIGGPFVRKRRLAVAGGREQQEDSRPRLVEERRQPWTLDEELRPRPRGHRGLVYRACLPFGSIVYVLFRLAKGATPG